MFLDQNLTYQDEVQKFLMKMAHRVKTIYSVRDLFPEKTCILLPNIECFGNQPSTIFNGTIEWNE